MCVCVDHQIFRFYLEYVYVNMYLEKSKTTKMCRFKLKLKKERKKNLNSI